MKKIWLIILLVALVVVFFVVLLSDFGTSQYVVNKSLTYLYESWQAGSSGVYLLPGTVVEPTNNPITCNTNANGVERCLFKVVSTSQDNRVGREGWININNLRKR